MIIPLVGLDPSVFHMSKQIIAIRIKWYAQDYLRAVRIFNSQWTREIDFLKMLIPDFSKNNLF